MNNAIRRQSDQRAMVQHHRKLHQPADDLNMPATTLPAKPKETPEQRLHRKFLQIQAELSGATVNLHSLEHLSRDFHCAVNAAYQAQRSRN